MNITQFLVQAQAAELEQRKLEAKMRAEGWVQGAGDCWVKEESTPIRGPYLVQSREQHEHNTDPQRRCYNGCHFRSEWRWTEWRTLSVRPTLEEAEVSAEMWRQLAKSSGRRLEYRVVAEDEQPK